MAINRRDFMTAAVGAVMVTQRLDALKAPAHEMKRETAPGAIAHHPNVILMICDDLGYGDLGCYGSRLPTPNLDRLASEGARLTHYNSAHPICSASRAALLTGRYAARSHTLGAYFPHAKNGMSLEEQTLADLFHEKSYRTMCVGKWHLGDAPEYLPTNRGFDGYYGVPYSDDMKPLPLMRNLEVLEAETNRDELTPKYTAEALNFLGEKSDKPFFLYVAYSYPHDPARASAAFKGRTKFGNFGDAVAEIDWSVGELMKELNRSGRAKDTVVLFTSDHGPWFQGSPGALRGRKGSTFEGGCRVPLLVRWPGVVPEGRVVDEWATSLNVLPMLAAWCGLDKPRLPLDGADMGGMLTGGPTPEEHIQIYFTPFDANKQVHCIRRGNWKLRVAQNDGQIYINDQPYAKKNYMLARPELYHLREDPMESYDVAGQNPEVVKELMVELEERIASFPPEIVAAYEKLKEDKASRTTPPGATPRVVTGPLPDWAWEPEDRKG